LTRAEHDQPRGAQPGELDDASGGVSGELLAGGGHAGFLGDRERIGQAAVAGCHLGVKPALVVRLSKRRGRAAAIVDEHERGSEIRSKADGCLYGGCGGA
jgi:hypothetical protein